MNSRIFSDHSHRHAAAIAAICVTGFTTSTSWAQAPADSPLHTDPTTGIVYRKVMKAVSIPVTETKMETREEVVSTPRTVVETRPEARTVYTPVVEHVWEPRLHGRWNPFRPPTVAYHQVPRSRWEARTEMVNRTNTRTEWVAEKRKFEVPRRTVRMKTEHQVAFEPVGRQRASAPEGVNAAIAARLQPLDPNTAIDPIGTPMYPTASSALRYATPLAASSSIGRMTSDPPRRSGTQSGFRATTLTPTTVHGRALPPSTGGIGVANLPMPSIFR